MTTIKNKWGINHGFRVENVEHKLGAVPIFHGFFPLVDGLHAHANKSQGVRGIHTYTKCVATFQRTKNGKNKTRRIPPG